MARVFECIEADGIYRTGLRAKPAVDALIRFCQYSSCMYIPVEFRSFDLETAHRTCLYADAAACTDASVNIWFVPVKLRSLMKLVALLVKHSILRADFAAKTAVYTFCRIYGVERLQFSCDSTYRAFFGAYSAAYTFISDLMCHGFLPPVVVIVI